MHSFRGRRAWLIESPDIRASIMECGAHVAETTWKQTGINPLWVQDRPTIDSDEFNPEQHGAMYGTDSEARLICGLLGHNLCLPWWGPPSEAEFAAGMTFHGETNVVRWRAFEYDADRITLSATLPESSLAVERTLRCSGSVLHFDTAVENLTACDRPLAWCEHVTLGPPFLAPSDTRFFASLTDGFRTSHDPSALFRWPEGRGEIDCDLTGFSRVPHADLVNSFLVDASSDFACFVSWNRSLGLLFGYVFRSRDFPWLNVWENNDSRRQTRGMEFSNTPVEGSLRQLLATPVLLGQPTFEWLGANGRLRKKFFSFSAPITSDFAGIAGFRYDGRELTVEASLSSQSFSLNVE